MRWLRGAFREESQPQSQKSEKERVAFIIYNFSIQILELR